MNQPPYKELFAFKGAGGSSPLLLILGLHSGRRIGHDPR